MCPGSGLRALLPHFFNPGPQPGQALCCPHSRLGGCWACSAGGARNPSTTTPEAQVHQSGLRKPFSFPRANALSYKTTRKGNWIATRERASSSLLNYKEVPPRAHLLRPVQCLCPGSTWRGHRHDCAVAPAPGPLPLGPTYQVLPGPPARKLTCHLVLLRQFALVSSSVRREL